MEYNNENLASLIEHADSGASAWVYNRHCEFCGKFLYPEQLVKKQCKKCGTNITKPVKRALPFLTSATAIEKLLIWIRSTKRQDLLDQVTIIITKWLESDRSADTYRLEIVIACVNMIQEA